MREDEKDEQYGGGARGKKASGMLMVESVLYMWVRNADNKGQYCELWWSEDHAENWEKADWQFEEFGYCTFINYGPATQICDSIRTVWKSTAPARMGRLSVSVQMSRSESAINLLAQEKGVWTDHSTVLWMT
jgi:hypothetical protein